MRALTQSHFSAVLPVAGNVVFTSCSPITQQKSSSKVPDPQKGVSITISGYTEFADITLSKPMYETDTAFITWADGALKDNAPEFSFTLTPVIVDGTNTPIPGAKAVTLNGCKVISFQRPAYEAGSANAAMLALTISFTSISS